MTTSDQDLRGCNDCGCPLAAEIDRELAKAHARGRAEALTEAMVKIYRYLDRVPKTAQARSITRSREYWEGYEGALQVAIGTVRLDPEGMERLLDGLEPDQ